MACLGSGIFIIKIMQQVSHTQTVARNLVGIRRTDALSGSADFGRALCFFIGGIEFAVSGKYQVGLA